MAAGAVAIVVKKALAAIVSDKKGRKFLGYVVGIAIFIVLLPVILLIGLFGWLAGSKDIVLDKEAIYQNMPESYQKETSNVNLVCEQISSKFADKQLSEVQINMAQSIYMSCLVGKEESETFYDDYADCFLEETEDLSIFDNITDKFDVTFTEQDIEYFYEIYDEKDIK